MAVPFEIPLEGMAGPLEIDFGVWPEINVGFALVDLTSFWSTIFSARLGLAASFSCLFVT